MKKAPLNGLLAFVTVAEKRGFSSAARALGVSPSALSQAVRALESRLGAPLLLRTTRSVNVTEAGRRLYERAAPSLRDTLAALDDVAAASHEVAGRLRLTVPRLAVPIVIEPVLPNLMRAHPRLAVEIDVDDRFVDVVANGYDAGIRLDEAIERDMLVVRVSPPFRFVVVGSPAYLRAHGRPVRPRDLLAHACIGYRAPSSGALYAWEFERAGRSYQIAVRGNLVCSDAALTLAAARAGLGLAYVSSDAVAQDLASGALETVLEPYAPVTPGLFLYFAARAQKLPKLRAFIDLARELVVRGDRRE